MKISEWLQESQAILSNANVSTARLDCLVLLADETGKDKAWLLAYPEHDLQGLELKNLNTKIIQRARHIPLAYIRGKAEFYGREFVVNEHTLVPRPETETIIDLLKTLDLPAGSHVLDVGTGSGCIGITAKLELPDSSISACDIDAKCIKTGAQNARRLQAGVDFFESNLLSAAPHEYDILLANLPYVPDDFHINTAASHEPRHAIFGGPDGLDLYHVMFQQICTNSWKPRHILAESLPTQHVELAGIAAAANYALATTEDFIQLFTTKH